MKKLIKTRLLWSRKEIKYKFYKKHQRNIINKLFGQDRT